jgi:DHA3 family macrolide efflux protein-like MFS transporter
MSNKTNPHGLRAFFTIWISQLVSLVGSQLTAFALGVWVYDETRSVLLLAITQIAFSTPQVLFSPWAGVLADRWNRRTVMIVSDVGAGLAVLVAGILYLTNRLQPWMVIPINFWMAAFIALMWPAYSASITLLVPREQYGRANGFVQLGEALTQIAGPALAGALYVAIRLGNMALIDFATYLFSASLMVLFVRLPNPPRLEHGDQSKKSVLQEMRFGWEYIQARKGLLALLLYFFSLNFLGGIISPLFTPLILDNWKANVLGYLSTIMGVGMLVGTLVMSAWGGGKRKVFTLLGAGLLGSLIFAVMGIRISLPLLAICGFGFMFTIPLMNASSQAIWQAKVAPDVQGRIFALRRTIAWSSQIVAPLLAAPLADYVFKPGMAEGGVLAGIFGPIFGVGENHGVGVLISILGVAMTLLCALFFFNRSIRNVEIDLPDHVATLSPDAPTGLSDQPAD